MEFPPQELGSLTLFGILGEAFSIMKKLPKDFLLITLSFIFPLSLGNLLFLSTPLIYYDILSRLSNRLITNGIIILPYVVLLYLLTMSSTRAVSFMVASHYTSNPTSFSFHKSVVSRKGALPFLVSFTCLLFFVVIYLWFHQIALSIPRNFYALLITIGIFFIMNYIFTAVSLLPNVISIIEPVKNCVEPLSKGWSLLKGKTWTAIVHVFIYLSICWAIMDAFLFFVVVSGFGISTRIIIGCLLCVILVIVLLVGLTVQSVFYFVCKSHNQQEIDKNTLCSYLGLNFEVSSEDVWGKSNTQTKESHV